MTIETKYNIGDGVWVIAKNEVQRLIIDGIKETKESVLRTALAYIFGKETNKQCTTKQTKSDKTAQSYTSSTAWRS